MSKAILSIRVDTNMLIAIDHKAKEQDLSRTEFVNKAIGYYLLQLKEDKKKDDDLSVILSALNEVNENLIESKREVKDFISSLEDSKHVQETFEYKMLLQFVRRICAGIVTISSREQSALLRNIFRDAAIWELIK
jgi:metal-responsive CopG/Arc/MetJ family transcriptional regulator